MQGYRIKVRDPTLRQFFKKFGRVSSVFLVRHPITALSRGFAFVTFRDPASVQLALKATADEATLDGRVLLINREKLRRKFKREVESSAPVVVCTSEFNSKLTDDIILIVFSFLNAKELLNVAKALTYHTFKKILELCGSNLKSLDLSAVSCFITYRFVDMIAKRYSQLVTLNMSGCQIQNVGFKKIAKSCPELREVVVTDCNTVQDKGIRWLFSHCQKLESINISHCRKFQGRCFTIISRKMRSLNLNTCQKMTDSGIAKIARQCPALVKLRLKNCVCLTTNTLVAICKKCPNIKVLDLGGYFPLLQYENVDELSLLAHLEELYLSGNELVDDNTLLHISRKCLQLRRLDVSGCKISISDNGIGSFVNCKKLAFLNISYLKNVTDSSLINLSLSCPFEEVIFRGCMWLTDESCLSIVNMCPRLSKLDMSGCSNISNKTFQAAIVALQDRGCDQKLTLIVGGTRMCTNLGEFHHPLLKVEDINLCDYRRQQSDFSDYEDDIDDDLDDDPYYTDDDYYDADPLYDDYDDEPLFEDRMGWMA